MGAKRLAFAVRAGWVAPFALAVVLIQMATADEQQPVNFTLYVATDGNDKWTGRSAAPNPTADDGPFATLERAKASVRDLRSANPAANIEVVLRGGTHRLSRTVVFDVADTAGSTGRTAIVAHAGETPVLSSGVPLVGWQRVKSPPADTSPSSREHLWSASVPGELQNVLTIYDGLTRLPRARGPASTPPKTWQDDGAGRAPNDVFYLPDSYLSRYAGFKGAELLVLPTANYEMNILPIAYVDAQRKLGVTASPASRAIGPMQFHSETMWIENRLEDLDEPGEWVYDAASRKIYLWPPNDKPSDAIVAPLLTELVRIEGDIHYAAPTDEPTRNLTFRGLTFAHSERLPFRAQDGWDLQHVWEHFDAPTALVRLRGAENCRIEACRFIAGGGTGVRLDLHCQHNKVSACEFGNLGGVGVLLAGYGPGTKDVNRLNEISNNWIHHIGELYWASPAVFAWQSSENLIANNLIHNTPYTGIVVSGRIAWSRLGTAASVRTVRWHEISEPEKAPWTWAVREKYLHGRKNKIYRNDISDVMERLGDGNGIYVSGAGKQNLIAENYIHDVDSDHMVHAIRCDDDQEETIIEKNLIVNIRSMHQAITVKGKSDIVNNVMVALKPSRLKIDPRWQLHGYIGLEVNPVTGSRVQRNVVYCTDENYTPVVQHRLYGQGGEPRLRDCDADYNLYYCPTDPAWGEKHLTTERDFGVETHSVVADPMFVDLQGRDFRFQENSPALALGIEPVSSQHMGLEPNHPFHKPQSR